MWAITLQYEDWFINAMEVLADKGFRVTVEPDLIVIGKRTGLKSQALQTELEFIEFANRHGARIDPAVMGQPDHRYGPGDIPFSEPEPVHNLHTAEEMRVRLDGARSDNTAEELARLRLLCEQAIAQREAWERMAMAAEARVADLTRRASGQMGGATDRRFDRLKRLIAREFHPDQGAATGIEKQIRAEIFKTVWPRIEDIERSG